MDASQPIKYVEYEEYIQKTEEKKLVMTISCGNCCIVGRFTGDRQKKSHTNELSEQLPIHSKLIRLYSFLATS